MSAVPKFKGIRAFPDQPDLVVPPLNFRSLQALQERLAAFTGGVDATSLELVVDATHQALQRNYPEMTRDQVIDLLDLENMAAVMDAVMDVSGLKRKAQEAAAVQADPSHGATSTPT